MKFFLIDMKSILEPAKRIILLAVATILVVANASQRVASANEPDPGNSSEITKQYFPLMRSGEAPEDKSLKPIALGIENYQSLVLPALRRYCIDCHGPEQQKGKIRFDTAPASVDTADSLHFWQEALDMLNIGDMPPEDEEPLPTSELTEILETVSRAVSKGRSYLASQEVVTPMRRLNKREYINTIRDLLGVEITGAGLPDDDAFEGFDTIAENLSLSPMQWEQYNIIGLEVASGILAENQYAEMPKSVIEVIEAEDIRRLDIELRQDGYKEEYQRYLKMAEALEKYDGNTEETIKHYVNFKGELYSTARQFKKTLDKFKTRGRASPINTYYQDYPDTDSGAVLVGKQLSSIQLDLSRVATAANAVHNGRVRVKMTCANVGNRSEEGLDFLQVSQGGKAFGGLIGLYAIHGTMDDPQEIEFEINVDLGNRASEANLAQLASRLTLSIDRKLDPSRNTVLWVDRIEAIGPVYDEWPTRGYRALFDGSEHTAVVDEPSAREILRKFADRAFRSQAPSDAFLDRLVGMYKAGMKRGLSNSEALEPAFASILASPKFLYLVEERSTDKRQWVSDTELANRLSYFLWSTLPDDRLLELAGSGELNRSEVLAKEVDRMIDDPKFARFAESFAHQWLELDRLNDVEIDKKAFPEYGDAVKKSSYAETYEFFAHLFRSDLSLLNMIQSDFVVVDRVMADFYGLSRPEEEGFQAVSLRAGSRRGGFLTQSSFLTMTTNGDRTSPVDRGAFVLRKFLDEPKMSPPPNVPQLVEGSDGKPLSIRQLMAAHKTQAQCAHCHRKIDPLGYALESYDTVGLWREFESDSKEPIDTSGAMPDGERSFSDFTGMQSFLLEDRNLYVRTLVKAMLGYGVGREISFRDDDLVEQIVEFVTLNEYSARSLLHAIVMSEAFQTK